MFLSLREIIKERLVAVPPEERTASPATVASLAGLLIAELVFGVSFLPVPILIQSALVLIFTAVLLELLPVYAAGGLSTRAILVASSLGFILLVLVLTATPIDIHTLSTVP